MSESRLFTQQLNQKNCVWNRPSDQWSSSEKMPRKLTQINIHDHWTGQVVLPSVVVCLSVFLAVRYRSRSKYSKLHSLARGKDRRVKSIPAIVACDETSSSGDFCFCPQIWFIICFNARNAWAVFAADPIGTREEAVASAYPPIFEQRYCWVIGRPFSTPPSHLHVPRTIWLSLSM